jgi:hypothetical protein
MSGVAIASARLPRIQGRSGRTPARSRVSSRTRRIDPRSPGPTPNAGALSVAGCERAVLRNLRARGTTGPARGPVDPAAVVPVNHRSLVPAPSVIASAGIGAPNTAPSSKIQPLVTSRFDVAHATSNRDVGVRTWFAEFAPRDRVNGLIAPPSGSNEPAPFEETTSAPLFSQPAPRRVVQGCVTRRK